MDQDDTGGTGSARPTPAQISAAWQRELPGVPTTSIGVITPLRRVAKLLDDDRRRTLAGLDMDPATLDLLSTLRRAGDPWILTTRELAAQCLVSAGAISQRVARAEADGLVSRAAADPGPRAVAVRLTPAGRARVDRVVRELLAHEEALVTGLPDDVLAGLAAGLDAVGRRLARTDPATSTGSGAASVPRVSAAGDPRSPG
jgi:DNA-binding MarR family transcriptional regulator